MQAHIPPQLQVRLDPRCPQTLHALRTYPPGGDVSIKMHSHSSPLLLYIGDNSLLLVLPVLPRPCEGGSVLAYRTNVSGDAAVYWKQYADGGTVFAEIDTLSGVTVLHLHRKVTKPRLLVSSASAS